MAGSKKKSVSLNKYSYIYDISTTEPSMDGWMDEGKIWLTGLVCAVWKYVC